MGSDVELGFISSVRGRELLPRGSRIAVAVSGGADSVAMLLLMTRYASHMEWRLSVLHIDHHVRPASSSDAEFVRRLALMKDLPFELRDLQPDAADHSEGGLSAARAAIYSEVGNGSLVAVGHTADDRAETLLMRLLSGSGLRGLGGMNYSGKGSVRRPVLDMSRQALREWLRSIGQEWVEDPTNESDAHLRNRIRKSVLPVLIEVDGGGVQGIARAAENLSMWRDAADWIIDRTVDSSFPGNVCSIEEYCLLPEAVRLGVLWSLCGRPRGGRSELEKADRWLLLRSRGSHQLAGGYKVTSDGSELEIGLSDAIRNRREDD